MGVIKIEGMEFFAYHGCYKEEQLVGTHYTVDIAVESDTKFAEENDDISQTVNYQTLYANLKEEMELNSKTIEHVARRMLNSTMEKFPQITHAKIKVSKLNPTLTNGGKVQKVSIVLETSR